MKDLLSSTWFITIVGGALASLIAAIIATKLANRRPSILKVYKEALRDLSRDGRLSQSEERIFQKALKDPAVIKVITTRASDPGEEAQALCKAVGYLAPSASRFTDPVFVAESVGWLLDIEFKIEGTDKYLMHHDRNRDRDPYFAKPPAPTGLASTTTSQQVTLTWNPVSHPGIWRYHISRSTNANGPFAEAGVVEVEAGNFLSFIDKEGLTNGTEYYYTVTAESRVLKMGFPSVPISALPAAPTTPSTVSNVTSVVPGQFFVPRENWQEMAERCIDRKEDLERLLSDFSKISRRLILIEGFGGLGKTTLTARLAHAVSSNYYVLWVNCDGIPVTAERFLREMGRLASDEYTYPLLRAIVENPQSSQEEKDNALLDFLAFAGRMKSQVKGNESLRPIALFFDDYHLVQDSVLKQLVIKIAESHIDVKVVLVIRFLPTELQHEVVAATALQLEGLESEGCRQLIGVYASNYPALKDLDDERLERVWKLTGQGVPAALRILISMTRKLSLDDALEELPTLTATTREQWFDKLFHELSTDEQQVATEFSIFRRPTTRRALIAVSRCPRAKEVIESLVDRFVLTFDGRQYSMHALWLEYMEQRLTPADSKELHRRAAEFYHDFVSKDRHDEVMSHLESCYHFVKAEEVERAGEELIPIAGTLRSWGFFQEFSDMLIEIEKSLAKKGEVLAPQLSLEKSAMLYAQGSVDQAIVILNGLTKTNTGEIEIKALQELGWIYIETGQRREAENLLKRSRQLAHQSNLPKLEAQALSHLQHIAYHECNYDQALAYNKERLDLLEQMKDDPEVREAIAWTHHEIGNVYRERGFYEEALEYYQRDLPLWSERGNPPSRVGWITYDIGQIYREQGKFREALKQFEDALQIFNKMQHLFGIAHVKIELGRVGVKVGPPDPAIALLKEAIELLRKVKGVAGEAYALGALGQIYLSLGEPDRALQYLQESLDKETGLGSIKGRAWSLHQISLAKEQQGKHLLLSGKSAEASNYFCEAQTLITQAKDLFAQLGATPNIRGIQDDAVRIQQACSS